MYLLNTSEDSISYITTFLDNKDNVALATTCIQLSKSSFMRCVKVESLDSLLFLQRYVQHVRSIKVIEMSYQDNPYLLLPQYPEQLIFDHCSIIGSWNPGKKAYATKYLKLRDYNRYGNKRHLTINWSCFPNLEELDLYVWSVDLNGIENCQKLKSIKIDTVKL